jgi:putative transposase
LGGQRGRFIAAKERQQAIELISEACAAGASQAKACDLLGISMRTLQRWRRPLGYDDQRRHNHRIPANKLSEQERQEVIDIANRGAYCDLPPCQIVPRLADEGHYIASESTFYRIFRQENMLKHRQRTRPKTHHKPKELIARGPNQVWSWDVTYLPSTVAGMFYYLYLVMDIFSRKIVGWTVQSIENSEHASWLITDICQAEGIQKDQVTLHSDNGAPMKGSTLLATLQKLGVATSFSRPSVSNDNPFVEAMFKTLKYCRLYPENPFDSLSNARNWVEGFVQWFNTQHYHSALKFTTPQQRHEGKTQEILQSRKKIYEMAKQKNPERWRGSTRNWELAEYVFLNPSGKNKIDATYPASFYKAA